MCPACMTTVACVAAVTAPGAGLLLGGIVFRIKRLRVARDRLAAIVLPVRRPA